jgi:hypothetical protein
MRDIVFGLVDRAHMVQNMDQRWALFNTVMNLRVP